MKSLRVTLLAVAHWRIYTEDDLINRGAVEMLEIELVLA